MDNLTHSLFGLAVGEAALQLRYRKTPARAARSRVDYWFASAVANNLPDLDFVLTGLTDGRLGYLLHHRGYTHTFLAAIPEAILVYFMLGLFRRLTNKWPRPEDVGAIFGLAIFGSWCHVALDFLNSYGVHPFWPLNPSWYYGDLLFIVEPTVWFCFLPMLFLAGAKGKKFFGAVTVLTLLTVWLVPVIPKPLAAIATAGLAAIAVVSLRIGPLPRAVFSLGCFFAILAGFAGTSLYVRGQIVNSNEVNREGFTLRDVVLSPMPANPFCWSIITVQTSVRDDYRLAKGIFAPAPKWLAPAYCPRIFWGQPTRELSEMKSGDPRFYWQGESLSSLSKMQNLRGSDCTFAALLSFARVPFVQEVDQGVIVGDFRFDYSKDLGFSKIYSQEPVEVCPKNVPTWSLPRSDIF